MDRVKRLIHCERAYKAGLSGKRLTVAVMDTGAAPHPDFSNRIVAFRDFCGKRISMYDDNGHGTHVAGIIGGNGSRSKDDRGRYRYAGIAPKVEYVILKVLDQKGNGVTSHVLEGVDWLLHNREKYGIRILNISVGMLPSAGKIEREALLYAVDAVWDSGIAVISAAGNNGPGENTVTIPGISRKVITVGSLDDEVVPTERAGKLMKGYTGFGPTECCIVKPEILAPGTNITSCAKDGTYTVKSGTSMAAPVVSGALALALERHPDWLPADLKLRLYESAYPRGEQIGRNCWGILHTDNLIQ